MLMRRRIVSVGLSIRLTVASSCTAMVQGIWIFICRGKTKNGSFVRTRLQHRFTPARAGWVTFHIRSDEDVEIAKELIMLAYNDARKITAFRKQRFLRNNLLSQVSTRYYRQLTVQFS